MEETITIMSNMLIQVGHTYPILCMHDILATSYPIVFTFPNCFLYTCQLIFKIGYGMTGGEGIRIGVWCERGEGILGWGGSPYYLFHTRREEGPVLR